MSLGTVPAYQLWVIPKAAPKGHWLSLCFPREVVLVEQTNINVQEEQSLFLAGGKHPQMCVDCVCGDGEKLVRKTENGGVENELLGKL